MNTMDTRAHTRANVRMCQPFFAHCLVQKGKRRNKVEKRIGKPIRRKMEVDKDSDGEKRPTPTSPWALLPP